jgi:predicted phage-related endonuclease
VQGASYSRNEWTNTPHFLAREEDMKSNAWTTSNENRRHFIGGSDARIIMGNDEESLLQLWREKRGETEPPDYSRNLLVQLGLTIEGLNRRWYERTTGEVIKDVQSWIRHPVIRWMAATLDGVVERAAEKHMPQVQHNMWVTNARAAVLSIITGGAKWLEIKISADPLYQHLLLTAEKKFWRCVESGEPPRLFGAEPPRARVEAVRIVDMSSSNAWAEFSNVFRRTREAYLEHENAKVELKGLMPEDAKEAIGHGIRAKRSKSGAVSFDVLSLEVDRAQLQ